MQGTQVTAMFVYGEDTPENRRKWEAHVRTKAAEAKELEMKIGSRDHHDFVFGSYKHT